jgi:hypothetical protein
MLQPLNDRCCVHFFELVKLNVQLFRINMLLLTEVYAIIKNHDEISKLPHLPLRKDL